MLLNLAIGIAHDSAIIRHGTLNVLDRTSHVADSTTLHSENAHMDLDTAKMNILILGTCLLRLQAVRRVNSAL